MTNAEKSLRNALQACQALLQQQEQTPEVKAVLEQADQALAAEVTDTPVFYASESYVRGPARPAGSGYKEMVFKLPSKATAQLTAENLSALFAAHCVQAN